MSASSSGLCFFRPISPNFTMLRTRVYIDGFNLYYGALRKTPYKWLNPGKLCEYLLPGHDIVEMKYFTAKVNPRPDKPGQHIRQQNYLRALETLPNLGIHLGHFLTHTVRMALAHPLPGGPRFVEVVKTEEKGSDVNLASHLLHDAHLGRFDVAVVVSNDSDLVEPIKLVRQDLGLKVGILCPYTRPAFDLQRHATFLKPIRKGVLAASQFSPMLTDVVGRFHKPQGWL
jgi:uncharacterized LabA/DUF88 family protein